MVTTDNLDSTPTAPHGSSPPMPPSIKLARIVNRVEGLCVGVITSYYGAPPDPRWVCNVPESILHSRRGGALEFLERVGAAIDEATRDRIEPIGYTLFMCSAGATKQVRALALQRKKETTQCARRASSSG